MINFTEIVNNVFGTLLARPENYATVQCEDKMVEASEPLRISRNNTISEWKYQDIPRHDSTRGPAVLLILESPHKSEFRSLEDGSFQAIGPAAGFGSTQTGRRIYNHFFKAVKFPIAENKPIFLINAIQYQCSLGANLSDVLNQCIKRAVFSAIWENGGKEDFIDRLRLYYHQGDIVVNACTGTRSQPSLCNLKLKVEEAIQCALEEDRQPRTHQWGEREIKIVSDLGIYHPSYRRFPSSDPIWE